MPSFTLLEPKEETLELFELPILSRYPIWEGIVELPPPLFFATLGLYADAGLTAELFLRYGPGVLRDIRLTFDPANDRYTGTGQFFLPVAAGPRVMLTGSLTGSLDWLGLAEVVAIGGGLEAIGQAPLILALSPSVRLIYDQGSFTFTGRPQMEAGAAFIFDINAFALARLFGDEVWRRTWNLYHWHWGRAVRFGASVSLDYVDGSWQDVRVEPFAERFSIDELLEGMSHPIREGGVSVIGPGERPLDERLGELLGADRTDPQLILVALAEASDAEKGAVLGDPATAGALQAALGSMLWPVAQRILTNAPSETVPSLDEGSVFLADRHIRSGRFQDALHVIVNRLQAQGMIDGSLAAFVYERETSRGEGLTTTRFDQDPDTGERTPRRPSDVKIFDPAFVNVPWLYSTIMHEYVHVLQFQRTVSAAEFTDSEWPVRREVEAYLWEIEHARGSGVIVSPAQMEEIGRRLTDHFNELSPTTQARYRDRYNDAMARVREATSGFGPVNLTYSIEEARRVVQESSRRIVELVRQREATSDPADQERLDAEIAAIQQERSEALVEVVLAENPNVQIVDRAGGIYRVPVTDGQGEVRWIYGSIVVVWHLHRVDPSVFTLGAQIRTQPPAALPAGTSVTPRLLVGGSGIQSTVQPFPGDIDFVEEFDVAAPDENAAGAAMAATVAGFVQRTSTSPDLEFISINLYPLESEKRPGANYRWSRARVLDPSQRAELGQQMAELGGGRVNSFWRALTADGRFIEITKLLDIRAVSSLTGDELFATEPSGAEFQEAFLDEEPPEIGDMSLGEYAELMRNLAQREAKKGNWLKVAKRLFNYFRTVGDLENMARVTPVFAGDEARVNQHNAVLEAISSSLDPGQPSRILTADTARARINEAANVVEQLLPTDPVRRQTIADELRAIASNIEEQGGDPNGVVVPDRDLKERLDTMIDVEIKPIINLSLEDRVRPIYEAHIP